MSRPPKVPRFVLNTGASMPSVGLGSWMGAAGEATDRAEIMVATALKVGYRAFDTAVGRAIRLSGVPREEIFVTTKMRKMHHHRVQEGFDESLKALGLDYVDLYLMHWPVASVDGYVLQPDESPTIADTWRDMEALLTTGRCKAIGVSNFSIPLLEELLKHASVVPAANQVELHPCLPQTQLVDWCKEQGIHVTAYTSLGRPGGRPEKGGELGVHLRNHPCSCALVALPAPDVFFAGNPLQPIADKYDASVGQVLLSWAVARGVSVIPKSESEERLKQNMMLISLSKKDTRFLNDWHKRPGMHRSLCPYHVLEPFPNVMGWTYEQLGWKGMGPGGIIS
ncbi:Aldo/keto reductase [Auriculariales sp. MPI-PUGE-AT-0066]|nr:Aldo/keto reductase [Auriculariales sp. MPI-PUGE-AT-0066]